MMDPVFYLASPYSKYAAGTEAAFRDAALVCAKLAERAHRVFSPIVYCHPVAMAGGLDPLDASFWLALMKPFMDHCTELWIVKMPGWESSEGIGYETVYFRTAKKPVRYIEWPDLTIGNPEHEH